MKLARFTFQDRTTVGIVLGDRVVELASFLPTAPSSIKEILAAGPSMLQQIRSALPSAPAGHALTDVRLEAPIPDTQKYMAIGMNYQDHADEAAKAGNIRRLGEGTILKAN